MRDALEDALESGGFLVITARDLGEAVDRLKETRPDLLIIRPFIDSMPAPVAVTNLRNRQHGLPVLLVSGLLDDDRVNDLIEIEEVHVFPKLFTRQELLAKVREVLNIVRHKR